MSMSDWLTLIAILSSAFMGSIGGVWGLAWWMQKKFDSTKNLIYTKIELVLDKFEEHEELDAKRFQDIRDEVWLMRVRAAARDGIVAGHRQNDDPMSKIPTG